LRIVDVGLNLLQATTTVTYAADKLDMHPFVPKEWNEETEEIDEYEIGQVVTSGSFVIRCLQMFSYYSSKKKRLNSIRNWLVKILVQLLKENYEYLESNKEFICEQIVSFGLRVPPSVLNAPRGVATTDNARVQLEDVQRLLQQCIQYLDRDLLKRSHEESLDQATGSPDPSRSESPSDEDVDGETQQLELEPKRRKLD